MKSFINNNQKLVFTLFFGIALMVGKPASACKVYIKCSGLPVAFGYSVSKTDILCHNDTEVFLAIDAIKDNPNTRVEESLSQGGRCDAYIPNGATGGHTLRYYARIY